MIICQCHILYQLSPFPFQAKQRFLFEHQLNPEDFKIILANNLGTYNLAQNEDYKTVVKALNAVDRNTNGVLTKLETKAFRQAINTAIKKASSSNSLLNLYDVNADGKIDLEDRETIDKIFSYLL